MHQPSTGKRQGSLILIPFDNIHPSFGFDISENDNAFEEQSIDDEGMVNGGGDDSSGGSVVATTTSNSTTVRSDPLAVLSLH